MNLFMLVCVQMSVGVIDQQSPVEQQRLLDEASATLREQAFLMKRAIEADNLRDTLRHASNVIGELRSSVLTPRSYYQLYLQAYQELAHLQSFVEDRTRHGKKLSELYESVQHAGNILPRLYLLVTVGVAYVKSGEGAASEILRDVAELCRGVQHPVRGLFLRYFLAQATKDALPSEPEHACQLVLSNFVEATKLWIRLTSQGGQSSSAAARQKREKERHELRLLVGTNLVRLSSIEGLTKEYYAGTVLPSLLDQITLNFKDNLAQQYLLDCIVQVFPDEFHVATLGSLLAACSRTMPGVDLRPVLVNLMRRLKDYAAERKLPGDFFGVFKGYLEKIVVRGEVGSTPVLAADGDSPAVAVGWSGPADAVESTQQLLELLHAFLEFAVAAETGASESEFSFRIGSVLKMVLGLVAKFVEQGGDMTALLESGEQLDEILTAPLVMEGSHSISNVVSIAEYSALIGLIPAHAPSKRRIAKRVLSGLLGINKKITDSETLSKLLTILGPLSNDAKPQISGDPEAEEEYLLLGKFVHSLQGSNSEDTFNMLQIYRNFFGSAGAFRLQGVLPSIIGGSLRLALTSHSVSDPNISLKKVFHFVHKTVSVLVAPAPETALNLWILSAETALAVGLEAIATEFLTQALIAFEEEVPTTSKSQLQALAAIVNGLVTCASKLEKENYDSLSLKTAQFAARLLKKNDQCRAVSMCAHLFWNDSVQDSRKLLDCLQKSLKIADSCLQAQGPAAGAELFLEILGKYLFFFEKSEGVVTVAFVQNLFALCKEHVLFSNQGADKEGEGLNKQLNLLIAYVNQQRAIGGKFSAINID